jgi:hypothetical protein
MKNLYITLLLIFIAPFFIFSQEIINVKQSLSITLDSINNQIIYQTNDSLHFLDIETLNIIKTKKVNTSNLSDYKIVKKSNSLLFMDKQGGVFLN